MSTSLLNQSKFKIYQDVPKNEDYFANLYDENILLANFNLKGYEDLTDAVVQYLTSAYPGMSQYRTVFTNFLRNSGRTREVDASRVRWKLKGNGKLQAFSRGNLMQGVDFPGLNFTDITIYLDVEHFRDGDTLSPEIEPRVQVIVEGDPIAYGDGYKYTAKLATWEGNDYIDPAFLAEGVRWRKAGSSKYSEGSRGYGSFIHGGLTWVEFEVSLSKTGKTLEVTDEAHRVNLRAEFWDNTYTKLLDLPQQVMSLAEAEFVAQVEYEKELDMLWGRSAGRNIVDPTTGKYRQVGAGLFDFLEDVLTYYPVGGFSMDMFENKLETIWFDRLDGQQASVVVYTGREGLKQADRAIRDKYGESAVISKYEDYVQKTGERDLMFKAPLFNAYQIPTFGIIRFEHWPALDSVSQGGPVHPKTGKPLTSYEYIILDVGVGIGDNANVQMLNRRNSRIYTYLCGTWSPAGPNIGGSKFPAVHGGRSYQLVHGDEYGLFIKDITATAWFKPNVIA